MTAACSEFRLEILRLVLSKTSVQFKLDCQCKTVTETVRDQQKSVILVTAIDSGELVT